MTEKKIIRRLVGDKTRNAVIKAGRELFPRYGFSGTSLNQIAEKAGINKSLILHHFHNKENLWKVVKGSFTPVDSDYELLAAKNNVNEFITSVVKERFNLYDKNKAMARLINWQRLEKNSSDLEGTNKGSFSKFVKIIANLQKQNKINSSLDAETISLWIAISASGIFLMKDKPFKNNKQKLMYQNMIIESILKTIVV